MAILSKSTIYLTVKTKVLKIEYPKIKQGVDLLKVRKTNGYKVANLLTARCRDTSH